MMFKIGFPYPSTIIPRPWTQHAGCTEYSVIPDDPNKDRYELHSAGPNIDRGEWTMEMLAAIIKSRESDK
jgi:hypothetical protein